MVVLLLLPLCHVQGEGVTVESEIVVADTGLRSIESLPADSVSTKKTEPALKVYSMNSLLYIETDATDKLYIYDSKGVLIMEYKPIGTIDAIPMSKGTYTVRVDDVSREVVVK